MYMQQAPVFLSSNTCTVVELLSWLAQPAFDPYCVSVNVLQQTCVRNLPAVIHTENDVRTLQPGFLRLFWLLHHHGVRVQFWIINDHAHRLNLLRHMYMLKELEVGVYSHTSTIPMGPCLIVQKVTYLYCVGTFFNCAHMKSILTLHAILAAPKTQSQPQAWWESIKNPTHSWAHQFMEECVLVLLGHDFFL